MIQTCILKGLYAWCYIMGTLLITLLTMGLGSKLLCAWSHLQVCVKNLSTKQAENEVEVRGPPVSKAFDGQRNPTKVLPVLQFCLQGLLCLRVVYFC